MKVKQTTKAINRKRRSFIKKAVYKAPILIALGSLIRPQSTATDLRSEFPPPHP